MNLKRNCRKDINYEKKEKIKTKKTFSTYFNSFIIFTCFFILSTFIKNQFNQENKLVSNSGIEL